MAIISQLNDHQDELNSLRSRVTDLETIVAQMGQIMGVEVSSLLPPKAAAMPVPNNDYAAKYNSAQAGLAKY
jgi:hypothetical protein